MAHGRHALPPAPRSDVPLVLITLLLAAGGVAALWLVDDATAWKVTGTVFAVLAVLIVGILLRVAAREREQRWQEAAARRREAAAVMTELAQLRSDHLELRLELRALREENVQAVLMKNLLVSAEPEPVYPSLQLPLVRAAFADDDRAPGEPLPAPRPALGVEVERTDAANAERLSDPRQLLDLTSSEVSRLRAAN